MTEAFWETYAHGAFLPEYCVVQSAPGCGRQVVDAVILPDEPHHRAKATELYPPPSRDGMSLWFRQSAGEWGCT